MIRKVSAHYLYINKDELFKYGIVSFNSKGLIVELVNTQGVINESEKLEFFNGMIVPGFVDIDISAIRLEHVIVNAGNIKNFLRIVPDTDCRYLVLENPESIKASDVDHLMQLENKGMHVILKVGDKESNSTSIFKRIWNLQELWGIRFIDLLPWISINPAKAAQIDHICGSIQVNKEPGLYAISGIDYETMCLKETSSVSVII